MKNKITKRKIGCIAIIIGVIILPLLYSYFYLGAFWDPYSRLENLPVAVVNNDNGALVNGETRNVGQEMCDKLAEQGSLKFVFTDEDTARKGTTENEYYAMIVIPSDFSADIASAATTDKQTAAITFSANEKRNYLASQILNTAVIKIELSIRESVNAGIVQGLSDKLNSVPDQMSELQDGMNQLYTGSTQLSDGSKSLNEGITTLDNGIAQLLNGANTLSDSTTNIEALGVGAQNLAAGAKTLSTSITEYTTGVDSLIASVNTTTKFLAYYVTPKAGYEASYGQLISKLTSPESVQGVKALSEGSAALKAGAQALSSGADQLAAGTTTLPQLKAALQQLATGLASAKTGSDQLMAGSQTLYAGTETLSDGLETAKEGIETSIADSTVQLGALDGIADYAATPVNIETSSITSVPNYGTAFAPYFLSLSLWVGGLMIFIGIYFDPENKFKIISRDAENKVVRSFIYLSIGFVQAVVLGIVLKVGLGLEVANVPLYFLSCCLVSCVFISIIQFMMVYLKDLGKFFCMVLLILQLTSCGGTFPMETLPKIFNVLYPFMPMTYSVGLFKQTISGVETDGMIFNGGILFAMLIVFMTLTVIFSAAKAKKESKIVDAKIMEAL